MRSEAQKVCWGKGRAFILFCINTAGGCLASQYLAFWIIARSNGIETAQGALHYVASVGEQEDYVSRAMRNVTPYMPEVAVSG
jgi:hypothetical protein